LGWVVDRLYLCEGLEKEGEVLDRVAESEKGDLAD
jgi:hypothetical protein